jgi:hypothetical protein
MRTLASKLVPAARIGLGLRFTVFGLNGFLHVLPQAPVPLQASAFLGGLAAAGYFFPLLKGLEVLLGVALLWNRFVPLALTMLAPIVVNIVAFQLFLAPAGLALPLVLLGLEIGLAWAYRGAFASVVRARVAPGVAEESAAPRSLRPAARAV